MSELYPILRALKMGEGSGGGGGGTTNYNALENKPQINSHELSGNKTSSELGLQDTIAFEGTYNSASNKAATMADIKDGKLTGYAQSSGNVAATDKVIEAIGKVEKKADTNETNISLRPEVLVRSVTSITSTTTLDDTGVSYTIPSGAYVRITATARYGQSNPEEIMIWTGSSVFAHTVAITGDNNFSLTATALIGGITGDTTAKIYAKFRGANTNAIILEVESVPNPS